MTEHTLAADFVVVGGGLAGVCAAIAAARNGAKVVLVQNRSVLGGNASSEVKMHIVGADCHGTRPGARESGLIEELKLEDAARNPHRSYAQWDLLLYEKVVTEPNITLLLDTECIGCTVDTSEGRRITAVQAVRNSTDDRFTLTAPFFADCSGDGRLGIEAGAEFMIGREAKSDFGESLAIDVADRYTLGSSILFTARRYDTPQRFISPTWVRRFGKDDFRYRPITSYEYGYWWFEWGGHLDTLKDNALIRHELLRIALGIWDYVKNSGEHPDAVNWALEWVGAVSGKRESRRFLGPHVLTENDIMAGRVFPDQVAYGGWWLDLHPPHGVDAVDEQPCVQHHFPHLYTIPLRCLYSRNVSNLFIGGRMISATHVAFASTRVMGTCAVVGQAIGTAAAIASERARAANSPESSPSGVTHGEASAQAEHAANGVVRERVSISPAAAKKGAAQVTVTRESDRLQPVALSTDGVQTNPVPRRTIAEVFDAETVGQLQQQLVRDDAFLPGLRMLDGADLAHRATVTASSQVSGSEACRVVDGFTRELPSHLGPWADGGTHRWESAALPAVLELRWDERRTVREIHLTFDSGFQRELILSASDSTTKRTIRGPQPELVRDYQLLVDEQVVASVTDNHLRKRIHVLPQAVAATRLSLKVIATYGVTSARVFEVRVYP